MVVLDNYKIPVYTNINDIPRAPTASLGSNGSYLVSQINGLITDLQTAISDLEVEAAKIANIEQVISSLQVSVGALDSRQTSLESVIETIEAQLTVLDNKLVTLDKLQFKSETAPYTLQLADYLHRIDIDAGGTIFLPTANGFGTGWQCEIRLTGDEQQIDFQSTAPETIFLEFTGGERYHYLRRKNGVVHIVYTGNNTYQLTGVLES